MTQQLVLKETGFYLQDSSLRVGERGLRALLLRALFSQETQNFPCSPPGYKPNHAQKFPTSLSVLRLATQTGLHPLWNMHLWVSESPSSRSSSLLQELGCAVLSLLCSGSGKHVPCCTGSWWCPGRHTSQESVFSVYPLEKQKSATQHSWS